MGTAIDFGLEIVRHYLGEKAVDDVKAKIVYQAERSSPDADVPYRLPRLRLRGPVHAFLVSIAAHLRA